MGTKQGNNMDKGSKAKKREQEERKERSSKRRKKVQLEKEAESGSAPQGREQLMPPTPMLVQKGGGFKPPT